MRSTPRALLCMVLLLGSFSGSAFAALCADVFPQDATPGTVARLDLSVMDKPGVEYKSFPAKGEDYLVSGDYFYRGGRLDNGAEITVTKGRPVRIFIDGDTDFQPHAEININGSAEDLLIVVRGNLDIGTKNRINALIYATKNISANPDVRVEGAMTAEGSISTKVKDVIVYDEAAAQGFSSGDLCTPGGGMVVDHYRLSFPTPQFSCEPIPVLIRACADANCSRTVPVTKTLTVTPTNRWLGNPSSELKGGSSYADLRTMIDDWWTNNQRLRGWLARLRDDELAGQLHYYRTNGEARQNVLWHTLLHVANHSTHHRAEACTALTAAGSAPHGVDMIDWIRAGCPGA